MSLSLPDGVRLDRVGPSGMKVQDARHCSSARSGNVPEDLWFASAPRRLDCEPTDMTRQPREEDQGQQSRETWPKPRRLSEGRESRSGNDRERQAKNEATYPEREAEDYYAFNERFPVPGLVPPVAKRIPE